MKARVIVLNGLLKALITGLGGFLVAGVYATAAAAAPQYVTVGTCPGAAFKTIQAGVNAVEAATGSFGGGVVSVCPGTYPEQVTISKALTLQGIQSGNSGAAVIVPPASGLTKNASDILFGGPIAAQILVTCTPHWNSCQGTVTITNITVDGLNGGDNGLDNCDSDLAGILFQEASGSVYGVTARNQELGTGQQGPDFGCQDGIGIWTETANKVQQNVTIQNSNVHDYQKTGIETDGSTAQSMIQNNSVVGVGPTDMIAQNGIQLTASVRSQVQNNFILNDVYVTPPGGTPYDASGILVYAAPNALVQQNSIGSAQYAVAFVSDPSLGNADHGQANNNVISASTSSTADAIDLCSNHDQANNNMLFDVTGESSIHFDASCGSTGNNGQANGNTINEAAVGILTDAGTSGDQANGNKELNVVKLTMDPAATSGPLVSPHF